MSTNGDSNDGDDGDASDQTADTDSPPSDHSQPATKNPAAVELGRRGGLKGGRARAQKLSPARRSEIARKAAAARWGKEST